MNILQFAVAKNMLSLVKYIIEEHRYISTVNRQLKALDPRIILAPIGELSKNQLDLLVLSQKVSPSIFTYLWETFPDLYTYQHVLDLSLTNGS